MHTPLNLYTKGRRGVQSVSKLVFTFKYVLDEHLLLLRRLCRQGDTLIRTENRHLRLSSKVAVFFFTIDQIIIQQSILSLNFDFLAKCQIQFINRTIINVFKILYIQFYCLAIRIFIKTVLAPDFSKFSTKIPHLMSRPITIGIFFVAFSSFIKINYSRICYFPIDTYPIRVYNDNTPLGYIRRM